jgi:hypothetical protein
MTLVGAIDCRFDEDQQQRTGVVQTAASMNREI